MLCSRLGDTWQIGTVSIGSVGLSLLPAHRSCEVLLVLRLQLEGGEHLRNGSACWVFFAHHSNLEVGGEGQPHEQKRERACLTCAENACHDKSGPA